MKLASFYYPHESLFKVLQAILRRKGYIVSSSSLAEGKIKARSKENIFNKVNVLEIKISKVDEHETRIMLMINSNPGYFETPFSSDDLDEAMLLEAIKRHF